MMDSEIASVLLELDEELETDYVGIWVVYKSLRRKFPYWVRVDLDEAVMDVCRALSASGARFGQFDPGGSFEEWPQAIALDRVKRELALLGRDPDIGEIAWLAKSSDTQP